MPCVAPTSVLNGYDLVVLLSLIQSESNSTDGSKMEIRNDVYSRTKHAAKKAGIPFNIDVEDIVIPDRCPVLGITLVKHQGIRGYAPDSPSIDKIVPALGYVKNNIRIISARANLLKNNATVNEITLILEDLKSIHDKYPDYPRG